MFMGGTDLALRMIVTVRTSSTRGARLGTRAGTCTAENEPHYFVSSSSRQFEFSTLKFRSAYSQPRQTFAKKRGGEHQRSGVSNRIVEVRRRASISLQTSTNRTRGTAPRRSESSSGLAPPATARRSHLPPRKSGVSRYGVKIIC